VTEASGAAFDPWSVVTTKQAEIAQRFLADRELDELLAIKNSGEQAALPADAASAWRERLVRAIGAVDQTVSSSRLPVEPADESVAAVESWLRQVRRARWD